MLNEIEKLIKASTIEEAMECLRDGYAVPDYVQENLKKYGLTTTELEELIYDIPTMPSSTEIPCDAFEDSL